MTIYFGSRRSVGHRSAAAGAVLLWAGVSPLFAATLTPYYNVTLSGSTAVVTRVSSGTVVKSSLDHQSSIQYAIDNLPAGRTTKSKVLITGDFLSDDTIYIPSYTCIELSGSITLKPHVDKQLIDQKNPTTGNTQIEMIGGTYDGDRYNQSYDTNSVSPGFYLIRFKKVTNSDFSGVTAQNSGSDAFILDENCSSNRASNMFGGHAGRPETGVSNGNGLGDRGDYNTWIDCVTDDTASDGWVIKCRNSTFTRCVAKNGVKGAGFGLFGDRLIENNKFYDCEVTGFNGRGVTVRKPTDPAEGDDPIRNNYFEIYIHDNGIAGTDDHRGFRLWSSRPPIGGLDLIRNNEVHLLVAHNNQYGFLIEDPYVSDTTGTIVAYGNEIDALIEGHNNNLTFLVPDVSKATIQKSGVQNTVNIRKITASDTNNSWAARKYYELFPPTNTPPVFSPDPITKAAATEDAAYSGSIAGSASDADGDALTFSLVGGPAWLSVAANGALSGTPASTNAGANSWTVRATDPDGLYAEATLNITVQAGGAAPIVNSFTASNLMSVANVNLDAATSWRFWPADVAKGTAVSGLSQIGTFTTQSAMLSLRTASNTPTFSGTGLVSNNTSVLAQQSIDTNIAAGLTPTLDVNEGWQFTVSVAAAGTYDLRTYVTGRRIASVKVEALATAVSAATSTGSVTSVLLASGSNTGPLGEFDVVATLNFTINNAGTVTVKVTDNETARNNGSGVDVLGVRAATLTGGPASTPYSTWSDSHGLTGGNADQTADPDGDGAKNLYEYALGGNPTNGTDVAAIQPVARITAGGGSNWLEYVYNRRNDAAARGLTYALERRDDLTFGSWSNIGTSAETGYGPKNAEFDSVTNLIPTAGQTKDFIRLKITGN